MSRQCELFKLHKAIEAFENFIWSVDPVFFYQNTKIK